MHYLPLLLFLFILFYLVFIFFIIPLFQPLLPPLLSTFLTSYTFPQSSFLLFLLFSFLLPHLFLLIFSFSSSTPLPLFFPNISSSSFSSSSPLISFLIVFFLYFLPVIVPSLQPHLPLPPPPSLSSGPSPYVFSILGWFLFFFTPFLLPLPFYFDSQISPCYFSFPSTSSCSLSVQWSIPYICSILGWLAGRSVARYCDCCCVSPSIALVRWLVYVHSPLLEEWKVGHGLAVAGSRQAVGGVGKSERSYCFPSTTTLDQPHHYYYNYYYKEYLH